MKNIAFHNLGCKVNSYELAYVQQRFIDNGYHIVPFDQKADVYIINTCTVTNIADRKSRQMLHRVRKLNPSAIVVAMGCYVETSKAQAMEDNDLDILIGNNDKGHAYEIIIDKLNSLECGKIDQISSTKIVPQDISEVSDYDEFTLSTSEDHTRVYIKIQDGCNQFCSYCAIPLARGRVRSRSLENIVKEVTELTKKGYKEFVLTGIHLSSYGIENYNVEMENENGFSNSKLIEAIEAVANIDEVKRIRLGSLEPRIITDSFLSRIRETGKICPHFHLSLQSGCDSVLKRMNRRYTADEFYDKAMLIREYFDHPAITTDVIAGFPGETDEEFEVCRNYLNKLDFYEAHIFKYSRRKGTVADKLPGQLTENEKAKRSEILIKEADERSEIFRKYYIGKEVEVLFEEQIEIKGEKYLTGYTREYVRAIYKSEDLSLINTIVQLTGSAVINTDSLLCK